MKPVVTKHTRAIARGDGYADLPISFDNEGTDYLIAKTFWRASWREKLLILFGRPVRVSIVVPEFTTPPTRVDTIDA